MNNKNSEHATLAIALPLLAVLLGTATQFLPLAGKVACIVLALIALTFAGYYLRLAAAERKEAK